LDYVLNLIKLHLGIDPIINIFEESKISEVSLLMTGGNLQEGTYIRNIYLQYFTNKLDLNHKYFYYAELFYLFKILQKKIITFKLVFNMISNKKETRGQFYIEFKYIFKQVIRYDYL